MVSIVSCVFLPITVISSIFLYILVISNISLHLFRHFQRICSIFRSFQTKKKTHFNPLFTIFNHLFPLTLVYLSGIVHLSLSRSVFFFFNLYQKGLHHHLRRILNPRTSFIEVLRWRRLWFTHRNIQRTRITHRICNISIRYICIVARTITYTEWLSIRGDFIHIFYALSSSTFPYLFDVRLRWIFFSLVFQYILSLVSSYYNIIRGDSQYRPSSVYFAQITITFVRIMNGLSTLRFDRVFFSRPSQISVEFVDTNSFLYSKNKQMCEFWIRGTGHGELESPRHSLPPNTTCLYHLQVRQISTMSNACEMCVVLV